MQSILQDLFENQTGFLSKSNFLQDKITKSTGEILNKFEALDSEVKTVSGQEESIKNAMEKQNTRSRQILETTGDLTNITQMVKGGSTEMLAESKEVVHESKNLGAVIQKIAGGINEMAAGRNRSIELFGNFSFPNKFR